MYSFPITTENGEWKIVEGLEISDFSREMMSKTEEELVGEREAIAGLL
jgi:malate dehydrogenase